MKPVEFFNLRDVFHSWERAREILLPSIELCGGTHNEDDVITLLAKGELHLWRVREAACLGQFIYWPRMKAYLVWAGGANSGHLDDLKKLDAHICKWAKEQGCKQIRTSGRKGWERALPEATCMGVMLMREL